MAETVQFPNIFVSGKVKGVAGTLQINKTGFAWKNSLGHKVNVLATELKKAFWFHVGPCCRIALTLKTGSFVRFEGLNTRDRETISAYIASNFKVQLENKELATKGWNWGKTQVENKILSFLSDNKVCFEVPLGDLSSVKSDKNDVILQFVQDETTKTIPELMVEMKLYVPPDLNAKPPSSSPKVVEDGEEAEEEEEEEEELPPAAENFKNLLLTHTTIRSGSSSSPLITSIPAINFFTPRGRLDLELYKTSFVFRGKGKDYQAPYSSILALSFLEISANNYLVVSLDPPIRQGNTSYQHLIASLKRSDQYSIEIAVDVASDEQKQDLEATMEGGPETILKIIKSITRKPLLKNGSFQSDAQEKCVRSSYKVNDGHLFPMEKYLFFVSKVPMMIAYDSIKLVSVHRLSKVNQSFDLKLQLKDDPAPITFSSIQKTESRNLIKFLGGRGLNISSDEDPSLGVAAPKLTDIDDDSEEEDDDFDPDAVSEDDGEYDDEDDDDEYNSGDDGEVDVPPTDDDDDDGASSAPPKKRLRDSPSSSSSSSSSAPPSKRARTSKDDDDDDL